MSQDKLTHCNGASQRYGMEVDIGSVVTNNGNGPAKTERLLGSACDSLPNEPLKLSVATRGLPDFLAAALLGGSLAAAWGVKSRSRSKASLKEALDSNITILRCLKSTRQQRALRRALPHNDRTIKEPRRKGVSQDGAEATCVFSALLAG